MFNEQPVTLKLLGSNHVFIFNTIINNNYYNYNNLYHFFITSTTVVRIKKLSYRT